MDNSSNGVVYISFGSLLPSEEMPDDIKEALKKTFSKLKQNVLWKLAVDSLPGLSKNVKLSKWLPQQDILGMYLIIENHLLNPLSESIPL